MVNQLKSWLFLRLLRLDGAILKSDSRLLKWAKINILKPVGYYFRKKYFNLNYK
jgi:hypothetical protein